MGTHQYGRKSSVGILLQSFLKRFFETKKDEATFIKKLFYKSNLCQNLSTNLEKSEDFQYYMHII